MNDLNDRIEYSSSDDSPIFYLPRPSSFALTGQEGVRAGEWDTQNYVYESGEQDLWQQLQGSQVARLLIGQRTPRTAAHWSRSSSGGDVE